MIDAVVFDGDDTLWETEPLYDQARSRVRMLVERVGLDGEAWEIREREMDLANVGHQGFSTDRFPGSCLAAYRERCVIEEVSVLSDLEAEVLAAASAAFTTRAPLMPDAEVTVKTLRARGRRLGLLTKGDLVVQERRIDESGLASFFDEIMIVDEKTVASFQELVQRLAVQPDRVLSVGNSVRSDIIPALEAGLRALRFRSYSWEHEAPTDPEPDDVPGIVRLSEVLGVVQ